MQPSSVTGDSVMAGIEGGRGTSATRISHKQLYQEARRQRRECERANRQLQRRARLPTDNGEIEVVTLSDTDDEGEEEAVEDLSPAANPIRKDANMNVLITGDDQYDGEVFGVEESQSRDESPTLAPSAIEQSVGDDQTHPDVIVLSGSDGEGNTARRDEEIEQESEEREEHQQKEEQKKEKEHHRDYVRRRIDAVVRRLSNRDATCQIASCATSIRVCSHSDLRRHAIAHYRGPKRYQCRHCKHAANDRRTVVQHSRARHPAERAAVRDTADEQMWFAVDSLALRCFEGAKEKPRVKREREEKTISVSVSSGDVQMTYNFPATDRVAVLREGDCARQFGLIEGFRVYHVDRDSLRRVSDDTQFSSLAVDGALTLELLRPATAGPTERDNPAESESEEDPMLAKKGRDASSSGCSSRTRLDRKRNIACQFPSCSSTVHYSNTARHSYLHLQPVMYGCTRCQFKTNSVEVLDAHLASCEGKKRDFRGDKEVKRKMAMARARCFPPLK